MELSFPQRVAFVFIAMASGGLSWSPALAVTPEATDRQAIRSPATGTDTGKQLVDGISLRPASAIGAPPPDARPAQNKRVAARQNGELLILMLHILSGPK
jgi:hypothetical protein